MEKGLFFEFLVAGDISMCMWGSLFDKAWFPRCKSSEEVQAVVSGEARGGIRG